MGRGAGRSISQSLSASPAPSQEDEIASLKDMASGLREQLAELIERLDRLEKEE
jgi:archaellum component FlaC